jgi:type IV pilus assembly protein PilE
MRMSRTNRRAPASGFTLIEVMIVVVIITVLSAIAYPSYINQVQRTRRADGKGALLDVAQRLERCHTRFGRYNDANCDVALPFTSVEAFYSVAAVGAITPSAFTLAATPQGAQADDAQCGVLRLTSAGQQGSGDQNTDANHCW